MTHMYRYLDKVSRSCIESIDLDLMDRSCLNHMMYKSVHAIGDVIVVPL